jgi:hypothetical protein
MAEQTSRIDIGFQGGQVLPARVEKDAYEALHKALTEGASERWHALKTADADVAIDLSQVVYLRIEASEQRVGF